MTAARASRTTPLSRPHLVDLPPSWHEPVSIASGRVTPPGRDADAAAEGDDLTMFSSEGKGTCLLRTWRAKAIDDCATKVNAPLSSTAYLGLIPQRNQLWLDDWQRSARRVDKCEYVSPVLSSYLNTKIPPLLRLHRRQASLPLLTKPPTGSSRCGHPTLQVTTAARKRSAATRLAGVTPLREGKHNAYWSTLKPSAHHHGP